MRVRSAIYIEVEVGDFIQAADHQRKMERIVGKLKEDFPALTHTLKQARPYVKANGATELRKMKRHTGNLALYEEAVE